MKLKHLISACALALPLWAAAVPAYPGLMTRMLDDGTTVNVRLHGDEFFSYLTDEQGFLMKSLPGGTVQYKLDPNGARLAATPILLESMRAESYQALTPDMQRAADNNGVQRMPTLTTLGQTTFPTIGENHYLVVLVQFADRRWTIEDPVAAMNDKLNGDNYTYMGSVGSMRQYYIHNSNGVFSPTFDIVGPVTMPQTSVYYTQNSKYGNVKEMLKTAMDMIDDQVDFSKYDIDGDGEIDNVIFFYAGYGQADTADTSCLWPHNSSYYSRNTPVANREKWDGKIFGAYCIFNELNGGSHYYNKDNALDGIGTPVHEFAHVMGLPDLYDPNYKVFITPGPWSVMDQGCYNGDGYIPCDYSTWERWVFKWIDYDTLSKAGHYTLTPLTRGGKGKRMSIYSGGSLYNNEYFIIEARHQEGFDSALPSGGMLVWHIDYNATVFASNQVNATASRQRVHLVTADGSANYRLGNVSGPAGAAAWPLNSRNYITPDNDINLYVNYLFEAGPYNHYITSMTYDLITAESAFDYDVITETPSFTTLMHTPMRVTDANGNVTRTVHLSWDEVPEADSYNLTLYRINSQGNTFYEGSLQEFNVGNVTSYDYTFTSNKMDIEFRAYVRPVKGIPSSERSNEIIFKPSQLEAMGGIEAVDSEPVVVRGLKGAIDAPASARVFTLTGAPAARTDLAPGIYLVNVNGATYKVIVK